MRRSLVSGVTILLLCGVGAEAQLSRPEIQELVPDGVWTWFNDERVVAGDGVLYIGSVDSQGLVRVDLIRPRSPHKVEHQAEYIVSSWRSRDDHNNPALLRLPDGRLLAAYAQHHRERRTYWRLADVNETDQTLSWGPEQSLRLRANATYNNLFRLSSEQGRIFNFIRALGFNPNVLYSDDAGASWTGPFVLIQSGDSRVRPYAKYAGNGIDRIDFLYTDAHPRDDANNSVYHIYYGDGSFRRSDGTPIRTLAELESQPLVPSDGTRIYDGSSETGRGWVWDLEYDPQGLPVAAYISSADDAEGADLRYRYARWDPQVKRWDDEQIAFAGTHLYVPENHYAGGIALDPADPNTVYISADVEPATGRPLSNGHYQIFLGRRSTASSSWQWTRLTSDAETDNVRPIVPRNHGFETCVIWLRGQYRTYTDYETQIVGLITP